jgi:hypothetical protein
MKSTLQVFLHYQAGSSGEGLVHQPRGRANMPLPRKNWAREREVRPNVSFQEDRVVEQHGGRESDSVVA